MSCVSLPRGGVNKGYGCRCSGDGAWPPECALALSVIEGS